MKTNHVKQARTVLSIFLKAWKNLDYQALFDNSQFTYSRGKSLKDYEVRFPMALTKYEIVKPLKNNEVLVDFMVKIEMGLGSRVINVRLIKEKGAFMIDKDGTFGVNPLSIKIVK